MKIRERYANEKAFTLIELMIVIAIIGILSAISIPNFLSYRAKAQNVAAEEEANNFYNAAMSHYGLGGANTTFSSSSLPNNFARNREIDYAGSIAINTGVTTGTMTFSHRNRSTTYTLTGATGAIED